MLRVARCEPVVNYARLKSRKISNVVAKCAVMWPEFRAAGLDSEWVTWRICVEFLPLVWININKLFLIGICTARTWFQMDKSFFDKDLYRWT